MSRTRNSMSAVLALLASLAGHALAQGESVPTNPAVQECAQAYEQSQEQRRAGELFSARLEFERCRKADCPEFIRRDCSRWSKELEAEQPTVVFSAQRGAHPLTDVRVSVGDRVLAEHMNAGAVELDPGEYDFRFETAEGESSALHAQIRAGDKDRLLQMEFAPLARAYAEPKPATGGTKPRRALPARQTTASAPDPGALPWVLLAVGVASLGTGAGLSVWGHNGELQLRDSCSPHCTDAELEPVRTKYLLSDVSFGVGLVSLPLAAYLLLRHPDSEHRAEGAMPVTVVASPSSVQASYGARF